MWKNLATAVRLAGRPSTTATTTAAAAAIASTSGRRISGRTRRTAGAEIADTTRPRSCGVAGYVIDAPIRSSSRSSKLISFMHALPELRILRLDHLTQPRARAMQPRLHRPRRFADRRGDLTLRQFDEIPQVQHHP